MSLSTTQPTATATDAARDVPATLQSPRTKLVYLYLAQGEASVDALQADLDISKITLYPILQTLAGHGLVERADGETFRCC
ncbi:sugar-specific transcriptional regulator trmb [Natronococcus amylolyticus DSM 10524]|uniref:Sugar-specific transcriptional regulator trmb n=1 Tax=Natronococcus amylolyticus DSM 10524 TaxID=1227497 RepID=L9X0J3_9EURY|nr:helix-turn-helix domain-containing protein [Natronococcus amylolyticus]ELY54961.1 sugar-specific transcriptional regulator trmb [Natronococcus amylolyticus DSM 10524]